MAPHRRTEFRTLAVQRLIGAMTLAGAQVFSGRFQPAHEEELEAGGVIFVYTFDERIPLEPDGYPPSNNRAGLRRDLEVVIEAIVPAFVDSTPDTSDFGGDAMGRADELAAQIEDALEPWDPPGFESSVLRLRSSKTDVTSAEGGLPVGKTTLTYLMTYTTLYRNSSDPMVDNDSEDIRLRGLYPGGQVIEGSPGGQTGTTCPILPAEVEALLDSAEPWIPSVDLPQNWS